MTKKQFILALLAIFALTALVIVGCSSSDKSTDGDDLIIGDPGDETFVTVSELFEEEDLEDAFTVSAELTFMLMDEQFGVFGNGSPATEDNRPALAPAADSSIYSITSYSYENGWHIFEFAVVTYVMDDTASTINGTDSAMVSFEGDPIMTPDSTTDIDAYQIRTHFVWNDYGQFTSTFTAHHSISLQADFQTEPGTIEVDASVNQGHTKEYTVFEQTDSMATCEVNIGLTQTVTNLVYAMDENGDPGECPESGSISTMAGIDLLCGSATSGDTLEVDGTWNISATVLDSNQVRVTFTDGTTTWTTIDECEEEQPQAALPFRRKK